MLWLIPAPGGSGVFGLLLSRAALHQLHLRSGESWLADLLWPVAGGAGASALQTFLGPRGLMGVPA